MNSSLALYALIFLAAMALAALAIFLLRFLAPRLGLVDAPAGRKMHGAATPMVGGIAICVATIVGAALVATAAQRLPDAISVLGFHRGYFLGVLLLVGVGVWDDRRPIPARWKLAVQAVACLLPIVLDATAVNQAAHFGSFHLELGYLAPPFTLLVMLTITNAINMIDGLDGLAAGICFCALAIMVKALVAVDYGSTPFAVTLLGALGAFLLFNFPLWPRRRASVFLGDAGSLVLGFTLAYIAVKLSDLPNRVFKPTTALWFFFIPVADAIWLYLRRTVAARAPFAAGRDHIHHILQKNLSPFQTTWLLVGASALLCVAAYFAERKGVPGLYLLLAWIAAFLGYGWLTHRAWAQAWSESKTFREAGAGI